MSDLISRQGWVLYIPYGEIKKYREQLPSAQPEQKTGRWINEKYPLVTCSICGKTMMLADYNNFCPFCGAKMDGKEQADEQTI